MNLNYQSLLPEDFDPASRVWVYQSSRMFSLSESLQIETLLEEFVNSWQTHGAPVKGYANLFFGQFIMLMADQRTTGVSGCSTDSSVRLIKTIESQYGVNMFDRTTLAFLVKDKIQLLPMNQLQYAAANDFINAETIYFNNLVDTKEAFASNWLIPVKNSWLKARVNFKVTASQ